MAVYILRFAKGVASDFKQLPVFHQRLVLDAIEAQLVHEPTRPTRNRKMLVDLIPPFPAEPPVWQLRVGEYRVFYDVSEEKSIVLVRAIRRKPPGKTTEDIL